MTQEIQDREIKGITGKLIVGFAITLISLVTTFEVGYFKIISKIELIQSERDTYQTIIRYTLEGVKQDIFNNREETKELRNKINELSDSLEKLLRNK